MMPHVGTRWFMLVHVGSCWFMLVHVGSHVRTHVRTHVRACSTRDVTWGTGHVIKIQTRITLGVVFTRAVLCIFFLLNAHDFHSRSMFDSFLTRF